MKALRALAVDEEVEVSVPSEEYVPELDVWKGVFLLR